nr:hypothetical protein Hi04_10k_c361_00035 [uncultured bacterium]
MNRVEPVRRPEISEVGLESLGISPNDQPDEDESDQGKGFGGRENVLNYFSDPKPARVDDGEEHDQEDGDELLR